MHSTLEELRREIDTTLSGLSAGETQRSLRPGGWSVQQTVEHLLLTYTLTAENFAARVAKGKATQAKPTLADRLGQFYVCTLGLFPKGRKAPAMTEPSAAPAPLSGAVLAVKAWTALGRFDEVASAAERLFGRRTAIMHPVLGPMSVADWRRFHLIHGKHHLRQVKAVQRA